MGFPVPPRALICIFKTASLCSKCWAKSLAEIAFPFELAEVLVVRVQYFGEGCVSHSCQHFLGVLLCIWVDCVFALSLRVLLTVLLVVVSWRFLSPVFIAWGAVGRFGVVSDGAQSAGQESC